ncbi:MAG: hypothetical protein ACR2KE_00915 [Candidatus Nanopelagicales bacterium]
MSATARKLNFDDFGDDHHLADPQETFVDESIILVREPSSRPRRSAAPASPEHVPASHRRTAARPRLLPKSQPRTRKANLGIFAVVCLGIVTVGLVSMLIVNTMLASGAFTINELQAQKAQLLEQEQQLQEQVAVASSPMLLEEKARALGMVPQDKPAFISLETGEILGNAVPQPEPIVVDPATGTYVNGYLIDPTTGEMYIDPHTGLPITEDGQPIGYNGETVDGTASEDAVLDPNTGEWVDPVTGQPVDSGVTDPTNGEAPIGGDDGSISEEGGASAPPSDSAPSDPAQPGQGEGSVQEGP